MVEFMFTNGPAPEIEAMTDVDGSGDTTIADLVYMVDYMFNGGPAPISQ